MLIVQTPFRMSFLGGGTDIPEYYEEYGGKVLSTTFDKYCYHTVRYFPQFFPYKNQLTYSKIERFEKPDEVEHPAVREILKYLDMDKIQITYDADLPARSGLGTSSSFTVGLLNSLHSLRGEFIDKMTLAKEAIYVERTLCKEEGGGQDQLAASFGGLNKMTFTGSGFEVSPVVIKSERKRKLNENLMLFFTGFVRFSGDVMCEQVKKAKKNASELAEMVKMVDEGERILTGSGDLGDFGRLIDYGWRLKRSL
ncbi:MAG: kinase, partial [Ruminococcaceae bacterium]|nr:kinase [Oscillospiraceae bacterium]